MENGTRLWKASGIGGGENRANISKGRASRRGRLRQRDTGKKGPAVENFRNFLLRGVIFAVADDCSGGVSKFGTVLIRDFPAFVPRGTFPILESVRKNVPRGTNVFLQPGAVV